VDDEAKGPNADLATKRAANKRGRKKAEHEHGQKANKESQGRPEEKELLGLRAHVSPSILSLMHFSSSLTVFWSSV
jgi:hypothetical protein